MSEPRIDTKALMAGSLALDQQLVAAGKTGHVTIWDARPLVHDTQRATAESGNGKAAKPNRITLAVDDLPLFPGKGSDLVHSVTQGKEPKYVLLLAAVSVDVAREVFRAATSRLVKPTLVGPNGQPLG